MNRGIYCVVSGIVFTFVALAHLARLVYGWPIQIEDMMIPMWVSWAGMIITAMLALWAFKSSGPAA